MNFNLIIPPTTSPRPQSRGQSRALGGMSRASMNPGGYASGLGGQGEAMQNIFKDRFSYINTAKGTIEKQREFEAALTRMQKEFDILDANHDGMVSLDEL